MNEPWTDFLKRRDQEKRRARPVKKLPTIRLAPARGDGTKIDAHGTVSRIMYACGHRITRDYSKGPISKRMDARALKLLTHWWQHGLSIHLCKRCWDDGMGSKDQLALMRKQRGVLTE